MKTLKQCWLFSSNFVSITILFLTAFTQKISALKSIKNNSSSPMDCTFERTRENDALGFCGWRPDNMNGVRIWHTGNAVLVDSVNSVVRSSNEGDRFAFVQGRYGAPTEGSLRSPLIMQQSYSDDDDEYQLLILNYWKASVSPSLDICLEEENQTAEMLHCVDTIQGPGQQQWVRRTVELPTRKRPYRIVLRARNLLAAEDIIGVDDIKVLLADNAREEAIGITGRKTSNTMLAATTTTIGTSPPYAAVMAIPKNPFDGIDEVESATTKIDKIIQQQETPIQQRKLIHETRIFPASVAANHNMSLLSNADNTFEAISRPNDKKTTLTQQLPQFDIMPMQPLIRPQIRLAPISQQHNDDDGMSEDDDYNRIGSGNSQQFIINRFKNGILPTTPKRVMISGVAGSPFPAVSAIGSGGFSPPFTNIFTSPTPATQPEQSARCTAVSCTFMDGTCDWDVGTSWHSTSHGSVSIESPATRSPMISAHFKPPVASYVDFDLWMSNDAKLIVSEQLLDDMMSKILNDADRRKHFDVEYANQIQLFTRNGATDGGWHRFRVPLRPSFVPVRLLFMADLLAPSNTFISLSNIRLVNGDGMEIGCESVDLAGGIHSSVNNDEEQKAKDRALLADIGLEWLSKQPAPLQLPPALGGILVPTQFSSPPQSFFASKFGIDEKANGKLRDESAFTMTQQVMPPPPPPTFNKQHDQSHFTFSPRVNIPFNPLKPMLEGIMPIIPLRGNPLRLTALMDDVAPIHQQRNIDFPKLIPQIAPPMLVTQKSVITPNKQFKQIAELERNRENFSKNTQEHESQTQIKPLSKQLYGATPIPRSQQQQKTDDEEVLLSSEQKNNKNQKNNHQPESMHPSQLTVFTSKKRNRNHHHNNENNGNDDMDGSQHPHTMEIQQPQQTDEDGETTRLINVDGLDALQKEKSKEDDSETAQATVGKKLETNGSQDLLLPSSVTSVLASSHHRGWVERAGDTSAMEFYHRRNRLLRRKR